MLRPLLTHFWCFAITLFSVGFSHAQSITSAPNLGLCNCIGAGQFSSTVEICHPGLDASWTIMNPIGVVDPATNILFVDGDNLFPIFAGVGGCRNFEFIHTEGTPFSFDINDGGTSHFSIPNDLPAETFTGCTYTAFPLACNNRVNVSMGASCTVEIMPDDVLEDPFVLNDIYDVDVTNTDTGESYGSTLDGTHLGLPLTVEITHKCSGNSCWGELVLEDKFIPNLVCADVTVDCADDITPLAGAPGPGFPFPIPNPSALSRDGEFCWDLTGFDMCGTAKVCYEDDVDAQGCDGLYASIITRTWTVTDISGRMDVCSQTINVRRPSIGAIVWPINYDIAPHDHDNDSMTPTISNGLNCKDKDVLGGWISLPNGHPSPETTGYPTGVSCGSLQVQYFDLPYEECGSLSFKIKRQWLIFDHCLGVFETHNQLISVSDFDPPILAAISGTYTQIEISDPHGCVGTYNVPDIDDVITVIECGTYSYTIDHLSGFPFDGDCAEPTEEELRNFTTDGVTQNTDGTYSIDGLQSGCSWIRYIVTDECGNTQDVTFEVLVIDTYPPTPVCDAHTTIALGDDGMAWANGYAFDDGSHDACSNVTFEVRRKDPNSCSDTAWGETVKFCCEDVGQTIRVELKVIDANGNYDTCWGEAFIQDNVSPKLDFCPADVRIDCGEDVDDLSRFGFARFTDTCNDEVDVTERYFLNQCGTGTITRTFFPKGASSSGSSCVQTITVYEPVVSDLLILWPEDYHFTGCSSSDLTPENLPLLNSEPIVKFKACQNYGFDYKDLVLQISDEACKKILRQWTLVDWCELNSTPLTGVLTHTQVITVSDSTAPVITSGCNNTTVEGSFVRDCTFLVDLNATATDGCVGPSGLTWKAEIDRGNDGSLDQTLNSNEISVNLEAGNNKVTWTVTDDCGNNSTCMQIVTVLDNKKPVPYCVGSLVIVVNEESKEAVIWASDFNLNSEDNCDDKDGLRYSFSADTNDTSRKFTCADLNGQDELTLPVNVFVTDAQGNRDFCTSTISIQDNKGVCTDDPGDGAALCERINVSWQSPNIFNCDDNPGSFFVQGGVESLITISDVEGANCGPCMSLSQAGNCETNGAAQCGDNSSNVTSNPIDISNYESVSVQYVIRGTGDTECNGCSSDDIVTISVSTASGFTDSYTECGLNGDVLGEIEVPNNACDNEELFITVTGGTQAQNEMYVLEITVCAGNPSNANGPVILGVSATPEIVCPGVDVQLDLLYNNCNTCTYLWEGPDGYTSNEKNPTITAPDIDGNAGYTVRLTDENGCVALGGTGFLVLSSAACGAGGSANISGLILNENYEEVSTVAVSLNAPYMDEALKEMTQSDGAYTFENLSMYEDYVVAPQKDDDYLNGVSTLDIVLIQQHILGIKELNSPYKVIAADANNSETITASDLIQIRKLILGLSTELPSNTSWRFVDAQQQFSNPKKPFPFDEVISFEALEENQNSADFMAVKIGDVNGNASVNDLQSTEVRSQESISLKQSIEEIGKNTYVITLSASEKLDVFGFQLELKLANEISKVNRVFSRAKNFSSQHFIVDNQRNNTVLVSYNSASDNIDIQNLLSIEVVSETSLDQTDLVEIKKRMLHSEIYIAEQSDIISKDLVIESSAHFTDIDFALYQNNPNPFVDETNISFSMAQSGPFVLKLVDTQGRLLYKEKGLGRQGVNEIVLNLSDKIQTGLVYYRLETDHGTATKKMIILQ